MKEIEINFKTLDEQYKDAAWDRLLKSSTEFCDKNTSYAGKYPISHMKDLLLVTGLNKLGYDITLNSTLEDYEKLYVKVGDYITDLVSENHNNLYNQIPIFIIIF